MARLTPAGNPAGKFPPDKDAALDAVFAAAKPFNPGEVAICVDGGEMSASRADALIWALSKLDTHAQLNHLADAELVPNKLSLRFHAIAVAADELLKKLGANRNAARFGVPDQIREGLKRFAEQEAMERGGFLNHPPEIDSWILDGEEIRRSEFHEDRQLQDNIDGVFQIRRWARQAEEVAKRKQKRRSTDSDQAAYAAMEKGPEFPIYDEIFEIWEKALGNPVRSSVSSDGNVSGPLICFTNSCLELMGYSAPRSSKAVRAQARRYKLGLAKRDFQKL